MMIEEGAIVIDREMPGLWSVVICEPYSNANKVKVGSSGKKKLVSEFPSNEDYPDDDPVVDVKTSTHILGKGSSSDHYTYPVSRLQPVKLQPVKMGDSERWETPEPADPPKRVEGYGSCAECSDAITSEMESYIEAQSGKYCGINCYNEALRHE